MPTLKGSRDTTWGSVHMDAIRGVAALVVVFGHTRDLFFQSFTAPAEQAGAETSGLVQPLTGISMGNEAVMIFFVLSGFLVGGSVMRSLAHNTWSWKDYLIKRLSRLWVVLIPALVIGICIDLLGIHMFSNLGSIYSEPAGQGLVHDLATRLSPRTLVGNIFFLQDILVRVAGTNESLWSLTNEFWYYILFPLLVAVFLGTGSMLKRAVYALASVALLLFVGKSIAVLFPIWCLGVAVYLVPRRCPPGTAGKLAGVLGCGFPFFAVLLRRSQLPVYLAEWTIALTFALLLYLVLHNTAVARPSWYKQSAGFLSRISYSLYLSHLPFAVLACALLNTPWHRWSRTAGHLSMYAGLNIGLVLIAYVFYLAFESRTDQVRRMLEQRLTAPERAQGVAAD